MGLVSYDSLEAAISACFGENVKITAKTYVGGGDINDAMCLSLDNGKRVFVKSNTVEHRGFFDAEELGLDAIASTKTVRTPTLLAKGCDIKLGRSFLMMEMIDRVSLAPDAWEVFGHQLAEMHMSDASAYVNGKRFGFVSDNYIGASKQINSPKDTWIDFFRQCRLEPQFEMAKRYFTGELPSKILKFLDRLDDILTEPEHPSLLHGDMWSGNIMPGPDKKMMLIDPAVYVGHPEADLAMTELFGRLPDKFYRAYRETAGIDEGYERRRDIYNLYHLLNHLNLFGSSYLHAVIEIILSSS